MSISIAECAAIIAGMLLIIFSKWFATRVIEIQEKYYGIKTAKNDVRDSITSTVTIGLIILAAAVVSILEITKFRL